MITVTLNPTVTVDPRAGMDGVGEPVPSVLVALAHLVLENARSTVVARLLAERVIEADASQAGR